jgi:hypothetical protein
MTLERTMAHVPRKPPDAAAQSADERPHAQRKGEDRERPGADVPSAGPHARPELTNPDATPGAGALTPAGEHEDVDSTSG